MKVRSCPATWVQVPWAIQTCLPSCFLLSDKKRIRYGWALIGGTNPLQNGHLSYFKKYLVHCYVLDKTFIHLPTQMLLQLIRALSFSSLPHFLACWHARMARPGGGGGLKKLSGANASHFSQLKRTFVPTALRHRVSNLILLCVRVYSACPNSE